jgi:hypothetical protein
MRLTVRAPVEDWDAAAKATDTGFNKTAYGDDALGSLCRSFIRLSPWPTMAAALPTPRGVWFIPQYFGIKAVILNGGWPVRFSATRLPAGAALPGRFPVARAARIHRRGGCVVTIVLAGARLALRLSPYREHFRAAPGERRGDAFGCSIGDGSQGVVG